MNSLYGKGRDRFANADIDWTVDTIRVYLIDLDLYPLQIDIDEFLSEIPTAAKVAFAILSGKSSSLGVCDANDSLFSSVTGAVCEALVLVKWTGDESTSALIAYLDTAVSGLPVTPNGGDISITWDNGANRIFKL
jgi:hypothetical protein